MLIPFSELFAHHGITSTTVLHLGANTGQEAEEYHARGVKKVIWVEALPAIYRQLLLHIGRFNTKRPGMESVCLQACLSDTDGQEVAFNVASNQGQSSSMLEFGTHATAHPNVTFVNQLKLRTTRVDTLLRNNGISIPASGSFLNIDLQGAELLALKGMGELLEQFDWAYIEVNDKELYKGCPLTQDIDAYLAPFGFVPVETKMTCWGWGDRLYSNKF